MANAQAKAAANTTQWQNFKARLDAQLNTVIDPGAYQGSYQQYAADFALGYLCLKSSDPATAYNYADRALAIFRSGFEDFVKFAFHVRQYIARGDGVTTAFTIPNADYDVSTLKVYFADVVHVATVKGSTNGQDAVQYYSRFLKVANTSDGAPAYTERTITDRATDPYTWTAGDWRHNPDYANNLIDWSGAGSQPAGGATYYVTCADLNGSVQQTSGFSVSGTTITFTVAPPGTKAVLVEYLYGTRSADFSALSHQETGARDGGFNNGTIDSGFSLRYLGNHLPIMLDWLWDYPGFTLSLKTEAMLMLVRWANQSYSGSYPETYQPLNSGTWESNYTGGFYNSYWMTALALQTRNSNSTTLLATIEAWYAAYLQPALSNAYQAAKGGRWPEGDGTYNSFVRYLQTPIAGLQGGVGGTFADDKAFATELVKDLIYCQPAADGIDTMGAEYSYPLTIPNAGGWADGHMFTFAAYLTADTAVRGYANRMLQTQYSPYPQADCFDLMLRDPSAATANWTTGGDVAPLGYYASGSLFLSSRAAWDYASTFLLADLGGSKGYGHYWFAPGHLDLYRGADQLLLAGSEKEGTANQGSPVFDTSPYTNIANVDDAVLFYQGYHWSPTYPSADPLIPPTADGGTEITASYVYGATQDLPYTFSDPSNVATRHSCQHYQRRILHVLPDYVFVHDRLQLTTSGISCRLQWHTLGTTTLDGSDAWHLAQGASKLFGKSWSDQGLTTTKGTVVVLSQVINYLYATLATGTTSAFYFITALQTAPSATGVMDTTGRVTSGDGRLEGAQLGQVVALFPRGDNIDPWTGSSTYTITGSGAFTHYVCGLQPNRIYRIGVGSGTGNGTAMSTVAGVLIFTTTPASSQDVTIEPGSGSSSVSPRSISSSKAPSSSVSPLPSSSTSPTPPRSIGRITQFYAGLTTGRRYGSFVRGASLSASSASSSASAALSSPSSLRSLSSPSVASPSSPGVSVAVSSPSSLRSSVSSAPSSPSSLRSSAVSSPSVLVSAVASSPSSAVLSSPSSPSSLRSSIVSSVSSIVSATPSSPSSPRSPSASPSSSVSQPGPSVVASSPSSPSSARSSSVSSPRSSAVSSALSSAVAVVSASPSAPSSPSSSRSSAGPSLLPSLASAVSSVSSRLSSLVSSVLSSAPSSPVSSPSASSPRSSVLSSVSAVVSALSSAVSSPSSRPSSPLSSGASAPLSSVSSPKLSSPSSVPSSPALSSASVVASASSGLSSARSSAVSPSSAFSSLRSSPSVLASPSSSSPSSLSPGPVYAGLIILDVVQFALTVYDAAQFQLTVDDVVQFQTIQVDEVRLP